MRCGHHPQVSSGKGSLSCLRLEKQRVPALPFPALSITSLRGCPVPFLSPSPFTASELILNQKAVSGSAPQRAKPTCNLCGQWALAWPPTRGSLASSPVAVFMSRALPPCQFSS